MSTTNVTCPECKGKGQKWLHLYRRGYQWVQCWLCNGTNEIGPETQEAVAYGERIEADRKARGLDVFKEAARLGCDDVDLSTVEMGRADRALRDRIEGLRQARDLKQWDKAHEMVQPEDR